MYLFKLKTSLVGKKKLYNFLNRKWFFYKIYNEYLGQFFFSLGILLVISFLIEGFLKILGPIGLFMVALKIGSSLH